MRQPHFSVLAAAIAVLLSWPVQAAEKTVVLTVKNADCALCAPIVKRTLSRVEGVKAVQVAEANANSDAMATVTYDDSVANVSVLIAATTKAGYPAQVANAN